MTRKILLAAAVLATLPAFAQTPAPAPAPAAGTDIPPMKCETPSLPSSTMMADNTIRKRFERDVKAYGDCVKAYVADRQKVAVSLQEAAKANIDVGNKSVNDYNALMQKFNDANK
jgi:hypothetical protein